MQRTWWEWLLEVPPAGPGQGTALEYVQSFPWPQWFLLLFVAGLVAFVTTVYRRDAQAVGRPWRALLSGLRLAVFGVLLFMISEALLRIERTGLPYVVVMIDVSRSMETPDQYSDPAVRKQLRTLLSKDEANPETRLQLVQNVLTRDQASFLRRLQAQHKLRVYTFSDTIDWVGQKDLLQPDDVDELVPLLQGLKPIGQETKLGPAVRAVLNDLRGQPPAALVVISDGITSTTATDKLSGIAGFSRSKGVPIYTVGVGNDEPLRDLALSDTIVDEMAFVDDPISFSTKLRGSGFVGQKVDLRLIDSATNQVLQKRQITITDDKAPLPLELTYTPDKVGEHDYILEVTPLPKEFRLDNNRETRHVSVRKEKIRVLLVDSAPRYEFRYLKHLLEREKTVELSTLLQDADPDFSAEDQTALTQFPVQAAELMKYDVILWGDVNLSFISPSALGSVRDFVSEQGGGLLFIAGPQHNPATYRGTTLADLLPVNLESVSVPTADGAITESFQPQLTIEGLKGSAIFRFAEDERASRDVWNGLPEFFWWIQCEELKPGAKAFATHPVRTTGTQKLPVIVMQRYGAGKVMLHATDETWRWRFRQGDTYYGKYWVQTLRYLCRSRLLGKDRGAELVLDRTVYPRNEPVSLRVRFLDERATPADDNGVTVVVERKGDPQRRVKLTRLPQAPGTFEGQLGQLAEGNYHAWVETPAFAGAPPARDFRVESPYRETQLLRMDQAELALTAERTGGRYYPLWEAEQLQTDLPPGRPVPLRMDDPRNLWNHWLTLGVFVALLCGEWILRKRFRLV